jgi:iron complex outermembrane receptor protein
MHRVKFFAAAATAAVVCFACGQAFCAAEEVKLERIVVTPSRYSQELNATGASVNVITKKDIDSSGAQIVLDALRRVPGLVVRDWVGNASKASVDIRGFGEQGGMDVLVLIDGRRVNEVDQSGVDWTQIPLNQVERIEVVRGGNSVLYGDNASSGVINIITKTGKGKPRWEIEMQGGSFDANLQKLSLNGAQNKLSFWLNASRESTHGYRNNSFYKAHDFAAKINYEVNDDFSCRFNTGFHRAGYGLPGALSTSNLSNFNRRYSKYGDDRAMDKDFYFVLGASKDIDGFGAVDMDASYRHRKVLTDLIGGNAGWNPLLKSRIDTYGFTPKYRLDKVLLGFRNKFISGLDFYRYDYASDTFNSVNTLQDFSDINKTALGAYLEDSFYITKELIFTAGYRYEAERYEFDYHDNSGTYADVDKNIRPNKKAYNAGLVYNYSADSAVFLTTNQSFRFPATDEYFTWGSLNTELKPQTSRNYEAGIRHTFWPGTELSLSFFCMNIKNELLYNPRGGPYNLGANENYDKTRHEGIEAGLELKPFDNLGIFGDYSYTKATFIKGIYDGKHVPLVPSHKGSVGVKLSLLKNFTLNISGNYTGERYFINDQSNAFSRLNSYFIANVNLIYSFKDTSLRLGVNNFTDKRYSEYGVCNNITGAKNYYPNPGRNFNIKLEQKF